MQEDPDFERKYNLGLNHLKESFADIFENKILRKTLLFNNFTEKEFKYLITYYYKDIYV